MKKMMALYLVLLSLVAFSCREGLPPTISVAPNTYTGEPGVINFTATGVFEKADVVAAGYEFVVTLVTDPDDSRTYFSSDGKINVEFGKAGDYQMKVVVAGPSGPAGEVDKDGKELIVPIKILNPFAAQTWALETSSTYQRKTFELNVSPIVAHKYFWELYPTGSELPTWTGEGKEGLAKIPSDKIDVVGEYKIVLIVNDIYGNEFKYEDTFEVISETNPLVVADVYERQSNGEKILVSVQTGEQPKVYPGNPLILSSEGSVGGSDEGTNLEIVKVLWDITKAGARTRVEGTTAGELEWTPIDFGMYEFKVVIENEIGLISVEENSVDNKFVVEVSPNIPVVTDIKIQSTHSDAILFEGLPATIEFNVKSPSSLNGKITKIVVDFDALEDLVYDVPEEKFDGQFKIPWTIAHDATSSADINYQGVIYAFNEAKQRAEYVEFSAFVVDNEPYAQISASPVKLFWDEKTRISTGASASPDGDASTTIEVKLYDGELDTDPELILTNNEYTFEGSGEKRFLAKTIVTNTNGVAEETLIIEVSEPKSIANFDIHYVDPEVPKFFADQKILLDASESKVISGSNTLPASSDDCNWTILFNDSHYASTSNVDGRLFKNPTAAKAELQLELPGVYSIELEIDGDILKKEIVVIGNMPENIEVTRRELGEGKDENNNKVMNYEFLVTASSPDGNVLTYKWYNNKVPVEGVPADAEGQTAKFAYRGGDQIVYCVVGKEGGTAIAVAHQFVSIDYLPPEIPMVLATAERTGELKPEFVITPADSTDVAKYRVQFNGTDNWEAELGVEDFDDAITKILTYAPNSGFDVPTGSERSITLYVQAADTNGNWSESAFDTTIIDKKPPVSPVVSSSYINGLTNIKKPTFTWTHPEEDDVVKYRYKMSSEAESDWIETTEKFGEMSKEYESGNHEVFVQAMDVAGNWSNNGTYFIEIDLLPPEQPVFGDYDQEVNVKRPTWNWIPAASSTDTTFYRYQLGTQDEDKWIKVASTIDTFTVVEELVDANYILFLQAGDDAGNWSPSVTGPLKVDTVAPNPVTSFTVDKAWTNGSEAIWSWAGPSDASAYRYKLQEGEAPADWMAETTSTSYKGLLTNEAPYKLTVEVRDSAGNWSSPVSVISTVDRTAPLPPSVDASKIVFPLQFDATMTSPEEQAVYAYKIGNGNGVPEVASDGWTIMPIEEDGFAILTADSGGGQYSLYTKVRDQAGNWSNATKTETVCGTPIVESSYNIEYAGSVPPKKIEVAGIDVTTLLKTNETEGEFSNRIAGTQKRTLTIVDSLDNQRIFEQTLTVAAPPTPVVVNGNFESSNGTAATGWKWSVYQFNVKGAWSSWNGPVTGTTAIFGGKEFDINAGIVVTSNSNSVNGNFGNHSKPSGYPAGNKVAFMPRNAQTEPSGGLFSPACWVTRVRGTLTQTGIPVFKDVTYKLTGSSFFHYMSGKNNSWHLILRVQGQNGLTFNESTLQDHVEQVSSIWDKHEITFTPKVDGLVSVQWEKTDVKTGNNRDAGGCYFDDTAIQVVSYPTAN